MTDPKVLADALVEAGIGTKLTHEDGRVSYLVYPNQPDVEGYYTAWAFVTDWRVAGKCLEKCWVDVCHNTPEFLDFVNDRINGKSIHELPRAIIEACVIALREDEKDG